MTIQSIYCPKWFPLKYQRSPVSNFVLKQKEAPLILTLMLSTGPTRYRSHRTVSRNQPSLVGATRVDRTAHPMGVSHTRTHRRAPQSSSGPRQPERASALSTLLQRRRQFQAKPQSDQRKRNAQKLSKSTPLCLLLILKCCSMENVYIVFVTILSIRSVNGPCLVSLFIHSIWVRSCGVTAGTETPSSEHARKNGSSN